MSTRAKKPKVIPPPATLASVGPLVIVDAECAYFPGPPVRDSTTAFAMPRQVSAADYEAAMSLGMRRSGSMLYRPLCAGCRKCQPFRVDVQRFVPSRSQRRVAKRCDGMFRVEVCEPRADDEHVQLYARYQQQQHGKEFEVGDAESYARFLVDTVTDTVAIDWRDEDGRLVATGVVDVVPHGLSTVYFYWDPKLRDLSLGVYSALWEIDLCRRMDKRWYYLGYLVHGSSTMTYKAQFAGGEVWDGTTWVPVPSRDVDDPQLLDALSAAERASIDVDARNFPLR